MIASALFAFGIASFLPAPDDAAVRAAIVKMQQTGDHGWRGTGLVPLDRSAAPALMRLLPSIQVPWVAEAVAEQLQAWDVRAAIPVLVRTADRPLWLGGRRIHAVEPALEAWGWVAHNELLRGVRTGSYQQRLVCARVLATQCRSRPEDRRFTTLFLALSHSPSTDFRRVAVSGLSNLSGRIVGWMEMVHPATMDNQAAYERLLTMALDEDLGVASTAVAAVATWLGSHVSGIPDVAQLPRSLNRDERKGLSALATNLRNSPLERASAVVLLRYGYRGMPYGMEAAVIAALNDGATMVRRIALACLRGNVTPDVIKEIEKNLPSFNSAGRLAAAQALGFSYLGAALDVLRPMLADPSPAVREAVKQAIARIEGKG